MLSKKSLYSLAGVSSGVEKPNPYATPTGDFGIGLQQLELYGEEQASATEVKTFNRGGNSYLSRKKRSLIREKKVMMR